MQLDWLHRQPADLFLSQPYEQLATVLRERGLKEDAKKVMIARNKDYATYCRRRPDWLWYGFIGKFVGYGYQPWRAFWISLSVIAFGTLIFSIGYDLRIIAPLEEKAYKHDSRELTESYPRFNALVYSAETFVPLLKLGVSEYWTPNAARTSSISIGLLHVELDGNVFCVYLWLHIIAGWVLTTLWVGGLTGLVKT